MNKKLRNIILFGFFFFIYAPLILLIILSFNSSSIPFVWKNFSFNWYKQLLDNEYLINSALISFKIAFFSATLSVSLGLLATLSKYKKTINKYTSTMFSIPDLIFAISLLFFFILIENIFNISHGNYALIIGHSMLSFSYVYFLLTLRMQDFDPNIEEAAKILGATPKKIFLKIQLPFFFPVICSAWFLAFLLSYDDVVFASFLSSPDATTLPLVIFSSIKLGISPEINALATVIIFMITIIFSIFSIYFGIKSKKQ